MKQLQMNLRGLLGMSRVDEINRSMVPGKKSSQVS